MVIGMATFAVIAFIVFLVVYTNNKKSDDFAILFDNISANDSALVIAELEKNNIPYKIVNENTIKVPKDVVYKERIAIASKGIPKSSKVGFELFDKAEFGETDFAQKIKYLRALEGELSRTVESLVPIKSAQVHIAIPKDTLFVEKEQTPTASVVVTLQPSMKLSFKQIVGIKNLVSASVPKLKSEDVKLIDENGNPLDSEDLGGYDNDLVKAQIRYKKDFEKAYEKKIVDVLAPILGGKDKVVAKVNIDFDFKQKREKSEYYDPENVVRSEKTIEEKRIGASKKESSGVPGAISNIGPIQPNGSKAETEKYEKSSTTTNYEVSKKITDIKGEFATIKKITVAVVVDGKYKRKKDKDGKELDEIEYIPLPKQELAKIEEIVKNSFGYDKKRGDSVSVSNFEFSPDSLKKPKATKLTQFMNDYINPFLPFLKYIFVGIILFIFYKNFIAPFGEKMLQSYEEDIEEEDNIEGEVITEEDNSSLEQYNEMKKKIENELGIGATLDQEEIRHEVLLEKIRKDIENSPEEIAKIIKSMLDTEDKDF
jgi:flagellar M-ring protein FliF